jgi:predicted ATPase/DNA-binding SARP family transcriptional activator
VLGALLLNAGKPVAEDVLLQALWGNEASRTRRKALQVQVSRLRARLGRASERIVTSDAGYHLVVGDGELDAARFEALCGRARGEQPAEAAATLAEALALWRGGALADLRYEPFAQAEIARLEELRWSALEARLEAELATGHNGVVAELERLVAEAPVRERLIELRMRALYRAGRHVDALAVFREARRRLAEDLGLEPGPALRELERAILAHDPALNDARPQPAPPPAPPTPTVGREREVRELADALAESRLVTLTGPGGVGKTRLAIEAARALGDRFPRGVHVAWLAAVPDAAGVAPALAAAVDAMPQPGERPEDALRRRLGGAAALLVADNFEHVLPAAALLADLTAACPQLRVLSTSREPLRLRGERCFPVGPLAAPDAMRLFVERARDRRPGFRLTDANADAVEELCRRLDGLPLALELGAGRIGLLEPEQLVARLGDALSVLEGGPRDAPARQRTIRATLQWSVDLLDERERAALLAFGAFIGGADLEGAERVTGAPLAVLDSLVAKSLLRMGGGRLEMLEVVRQYASAMLSESAEHDRVRERHADWVLELAEQVADDVRIRGAGPALQTLDREIGNLRSALEWSLGRGDGERSLRLASAMQAHAGIRFAEDEGIRALDAALALGGPARERGRAHWARAALLWRHKERQREDAAAALDLAIASRDPEGQCVALEMLSTLAAIDADYDRAVELASRQRALAEALGDPLLVALAVGRQAFAEPHMVTARPFLEEATVLLRRCGGARELSRVMLAVVWVAVLDEDYDAAEEVAVDGLRVADEAGDRFIWMALVGNGGYAALFRDRIDVAERRFRAQLQVCRDERIDPAWRADPLLGLAAVAACAGDAERAALLAGASEAPMRELMDEADRPVVERVFDRFLASARATLGEASWSRATAAGAALTLDELFRLTLEQAESSPVGAPTLPR